MSDEFEDISVAAEPVDVSGPMPEAPAAPEPIPVPVDSTVNGDKALKVDLVAANSVLEDNDRQVAGEINGNGNGDDSRPALTEVGRQAQEAAKEEKREAAAQSFEQQSQELARRQEFLNSNHNFGGMNMSGHDLAKIIDAYNNNPQMQDKMRERLGKSGMSKEKVDKTMKDFDEYMKILEKQSKGEKLTDEELRRKIQLDKDKDVVAAANLATSIVKNDGMKSEVKQDKNTVALQAANIADARLQGKAAVIQANHVNSNANIVVAKNEFEEDAAAAFGKTHFASAPDLKDDFSASANRKVAANDASFVLDADAPNADVAAQAQTQALAKAKIAALDNSFG